MFSTKWVRSARGFGVAAAATVVGAGAAVVPASPAHAHEVFTGTPGGAGTVLVGHTGSTHRYAGVCSDGSTLVTGWFWYADGNVFVGSRGADGCSSWNLERSIVQFYGCDHKGCTPFKYV